MKYLILTLFLLITGTASSQTGLYWSQTIDVINTSALDNDRPRVTLVDGESRPLVTWGRAIGGKKAYVARYGTNGFDMPILLNNGSNVNASTFESSEIAARGDTAYAVFTTYPLSNIKVMLQSSFDGGQNWNSPIWVDSLTGDFATFANVTIGPAGNPIVMYIRQASNWNDPRFVMRKSTDAGLTYQPEVLLNTLAPGNEVCDCCAADIAYKDNRLVSLFRNNDQNLRDHWATISNDSGLSFTSAIDMDTIDWQVSACPTTGPSMYINGDSLYGIFYSRGGINGLARVYVGVAHMGTGQLGTHRALDGNVPDAIVQNRPMMAGNGDTLGVVWTANTNGNTDVYMTYSVNGSSDLFSNPRYNVSSSAAGTQTDADISFANGVFHIVYSDNPAGNVKYRTATIGPPVGTDPSLPNTLKLNIWPQPAQNEIQIEALGFTSQEIMAEWVSIDGRTIHKEAIRPGRNILQKNGFGPGVYMLKASDSVTGQFLVKRVSFLD